MGEERGGIPHFDVLAIISQSKDRVMGGKQLTLLAQDEEEQKSMAKEIALTLRGDVVKLKFGDYLVLRRS